MKYTKYILLFLILFGSCLHSLAEEKQKPDSKELRMAIITGTGKQAPDPRIPVLIESELIDVDKKVQFVERQEVNKILSEQELNLSALVKPENAIKVGKLLAADILFFVDKTKIGKENLLRLVFVETKTGIRLLSVFNTEKEVMDKPEIIRDFAAKALAKAKTPPENLVYVGLLSFRSEETGHSLDGLVETLGMLLEHDLAASNQVIVLERSQLRRLTEEKELSAIELKLKSSTVLLEGKVKYNSDRSKIIERVKLFTLF